jgi:NADPH-dependent curcumin reductase CurA
MLQKLEPSLLGSVPLSYFLGTLGMPGMTAWASIKRIAEPIKQGEVAFVSGAAGAVGLVAGQLLKNVYGCRVIGSAGSDDKVRRLMSTDASFSVVVMVLSGRPFVLLPREVGVCFCCCCGRFGLTVGQLLKNVYGCRVIGSAGSDDKVCDLKATAFQKAVTTRCVI